MKSFTSKVYQIIGIGIVAVAFLLPSGAFADTQIYPANSTVLPSGNIWTVRTGIITDFSNYNYTDPSVTQWSGYTYPYTLNLQASMGSSPAGSYTLQTGTGGLPVDPDSYGYFEWNGSSVSTSSTTRIISFTPEEGEVLTSGVPVDFNLLAYISSADLSDYIGIQISYQNFDQNSLVFNTIDSRNFLLDENATTSGYFSFASTTSLADGGYRVQAKLIRSYLGILKNPFSDVNEVYSHQFVVGQNTYLSALLQNTNSQLGTYLASSTATSSISNASSCNPFSFSLVECLSALFIPDSAGLERAFTNLRTNFLSYMPWGYVTRVFTILGTEATSSPATIDIVFGDSFPVGIRGQHIAFDPFTAFSSGVFGTATSSDSGQTLLEEFMSIWNVIVYSGLMIAIVHDIINHSSHKKIDNTKIT